MIISYAEASRAIESLSATMLTEQGTPPTNPLLKIALEYAARGEAVFPVHSVIEGDCTCGNPNCRNAGKHPATTDGFKSATFDPETIGNWWGQGARYNIGVATGAISGTVVVDIDPKNGGDVTWEDLVAVYGLPQTRIIQSGGGGLHVILKHPGGKVRTGTDVLGRGIDIRADGGYVVGVGSTHVSGNLYELLSDVEPADLPQWIADRLAGGNSTSASTAVSGAKYDEAGKMTDGREGLMRDLVYKHFRRLLKKDGLPPTAEQIAKAAWKEFKEKAVVGDHTYEEAFKKSCDLLRRYHEGQVQVEAEATQDIATTDAARIRDIVHEKAVLWCDPQGRAYATVRVDDVERHYGLEERAFGDFVYMSFNAAHHRMPSKRVLTEALEGIAAEARTQGPMHEARKRIGYDGGKLYVDLCNDRWEAVEVDQDGYRVVSAPKVKFVRAPHMHSMPYPVAGGSIDELRPFVNYSSEDQFILMVSWVLGCFREKPPFVGLSINGKKNSGKSSTATVLASLVDPSDLARTVKPKSPEDLLLAARNSWLPSFDNLSGLSSQLSDILCAILTGAAVRTRLLYSNVGEEVFSVGRPVILNGIPTLAQASDLADRCITLELEAIDLDRKRRFATNEAFECAFTETHPRLFGALLEALSTAMRRFEEVKGKHDLTDIRMTDFAYWACAASPTLGWREEAFLSAYRDSLRAGLMATIEADPVAAAVMWLMSSRTTYEGRMSDLLNALRSCPLPRGNDFPATPKVLSNKLNRAQDGLAEFGYVIKRLPRSARGTKVKITGPELEATELPNLNEVIERLRLSITSKGKEPLPAGA